MRKLLLLHHFILTRLLSLRLLCFSCRCCVRVAVATPLLLYGPLSTSHSSLKNPLPTPTHRVTLNYASYQQYGSPACCDYSRPRIVLVDRISAARAAS